MAPEGIEALSFDATENAQILLQETQESTFA